MDRSDRAPPMGKPTRAAASPAIARDATPTRPPRALSKAVRRRAVAVSEKLAARGLGAFVWGKKLDRDLSRGVLPGIVSARSERLRCLARRKEADGVRAASAAARRASPSMPPATASIARAEEAAKEAAFLVEQSRRRAGIRFAEGRPRRIDMLVESLAGARRCALAAFRGASAEEMEELGEEIRAQAGVDTGNGPFWEASMMLCDAEISKAGRGGGYLHSEVASDMMSFVEGKSLEELDAMEKTIAVRMATGESKIGDQLQEVIGLIQVEKASKFLAQNYSSGDDVPPSFDDCKTDARSEREGDRIADADEEGSEPLRPVALPATLTPAAAGTEWRKPKYVARARTGYEWNKYNRVHYDHDHPPPKTVRGYTFVLHYPELAAGGKTPQCAVEEEGGGGGGDTCIVRFHAGWPYEDVAFRIVNREWERSRKSGFRCTFDRGVLRLSFHFKRFFYKR
ncbi:unnamed protein product [Urochloa decumbens]|uniref:Splicing factor Cactin n=1 Tax=Urochloa decumbens TaxID=240449 RepID=A0ABC9F5G6_9POAL